MTPFLSPCDPWIREDTALLRMEDPSDLVPIPVVLDLYTRTTGGSKKSRSNFRKSSWSTPTKIPMQIHEEWMGNPFSEERPEAPPRTRKANLPGMVLLHVYDIQYLTALSTVTGMPAFHLGIEVHDREYMFTTGGIHWIPAKRLKSGDKNSHLQDHHIYRDTVQLGVTYLTASQVLEKINRMKRDWPGSAYNLFGPNCQTFAVIFSEILGLGSHAIPPEYCCYSEVALFGGSSPSPSKAISAKDAVDEASSSMLSACSNPWCASGIPQQARTGDSDPAPPCEPVVAAMPAHTCRDVVASWRTQEACP